jgi:outer membrane translocation and assembly module TamA
MDKALLQVAPPELGPVVQSEAVWGEGKPYSAFGYWFIRSRIKEVLHQRGYLDARVDISQQPPRKDGDLYRVSLVVAVNAGPQYHVSSISADGGPLLAGKDLSRFFEMKPGDVPGPYPLAGLASEIRQLYLHYGFADVEVETLPTLDRDHALVAYRLRVITGPTYQLRSLTIHNLDASQESRVRELLGMKPGDIYLDEAVNGLYHKIAYEPLLKGLTFSFGPRRDKTAEVIDLTLDFSKNGNESSVTIK